MNEQNPRRRFFHRTASLLDPADLAGRLRRGTRGELLTDGPDDGPGRHPPCVFAPRTERDLLDAVAIAADLGAATAVRGAGSSGSGAAARAALVLDLSRHLDAVVEVDPRTRMATVQAGATVASVEAALAPHGLWLPAAAGLSERATIGGMVGGDAWGALELGHGRTVHALTGIEAVLEDGTQPYLGRFGDGGDMVVSGRRMAELVPALFTIAHRERAAIERARAGLLHRPPWRRLDIFFPQAPRPYTHDGLPNLSHLLAGAGGRLAIARRARLRVSLRPAVRTLGVLRFGRVADAVAATALAAALSPAGVVLLDGATLDRARDDPALGAAFGPVPGVGARVATDAALAIEFHGEDPAPHLAALDLLAARAAERGWPARAAVLDRSAPAFAWRRLAAAARIDARRLDGECVVPLAQAGAFAKALAEAIAREACPTAWQGVVSAGLLHAWPAEAGAEDGGLARWNARRLGGAAAGTGGLGDPEDTLRLRRASLDVDRAFDPRGLLAGGFPASGSG